jgi:hypothetical protein
VLLGALALSGPSAAADGAKVEAEGIDFIVVDRPAKRRLVVSIAGITPTYWLSDWEIILNTLGRLPPRSSFRHAAQAYLDTHRPGCTVTTASERRQFEHWVSYHC